MKKSESFRLACYNLKTFKKSRKQYFVSIFMVTFFMMLFCSVSLIIQQVYDSIIYDRISTNFINIYLTLNSGGNEIADEASELLQKIKSLDHINLGAKYTLVNLLEEEECYSVNIEEVKCFVQGNEYVGEDDYSYSFLLLFLFPRHILSLTMQTQIIILLLIFFSFSSFLPIAKV